MWFWDSIACCSKFLIGMFLPCFPTNLKKVNKPWSICQISCWGSGKFANRLTKSSFVYIWKQNVAAMCWKKEHFLKVKKSKINQPLEQCALQEINGRSGVLRVHMLCVLQVREVWLFANLGQSANKNSHEMQKSRYFWARYSFWIFLSRKNTPVKNEN